ncbi:MAG: OmpA family protein, partial [candidate division Zixibacteria bacterium]|nr:OmpA family protein [candidate division Zixibacteria bacterium]
MRRRRKKMENGDNHERWLLTYADMITLLLAFFIVMYSMSRIDAKKFGKVTEALNSVLKGGTSVLRKEVAEDQKTGHGLLKFGSLRLVQQKIQERFQTLGRNEELQTEITERGLVIHIVESSLFDEGSAELKPRALDVLDLVATQIADMPNHIRIEGHTDDRPIQTAQYPSNWELSSARATSVVRYLSDG